MSLDFSTRHELEPLARIITDLQTVAGGFGTESLLIGATARDIRLKYQHGLDNLRATEDVDFAVTVADWETFEQLRAALLGSGLFHAGEGRAVHKLCHHTNWKLDLVPFGGVESADRTIRWPPEQSEIYDCFGLAEAMATCEWAVLPSGIRARIPSIPALALLKITAWRDRQDSAPGKDAPDLLKYMRHYMDCGNLDRVIADHADLYARDDFDHDEAGARLLSRDIQELVDAGGAEHLHAVLAPEADLDGSLKLARQSGMKVEKAVRLISAFVDELGRQEGSM